MIYEILIITLGIALVVAGYVIPGKKEDDDSNVEAFSKEQVREMVSEEVESAKGQITDIVDETINYAMEKTERSMDRLSNEKMMAVSEYSDTVLDQINKSHEEVVFLYDMLNDKHENLKETVAEATRAASEVQEKIKEADNVEIQIAQKIEKEESKEIPVENEEPEFVPASPAKKRNKPVPVIKQIPVPAPAPAADEDEDEEEELEEEWDDFDDDDEIDDIDDGPEISFNARTPGNRNSNDRILELHKAGKSNMAIAKELGLGVGEVKLVIDLFKGL